MAEKSREMSGWGWGFGGSEARSKDCRRCLSVRRWVIRKRLASVGVDFGVMRAAACWRERVVAAVVWWARSLKMGGCGLVLVSGGKGGGRKGGLR